MRTLIILSFCLLFLSNACITVNSGSNTDSVDLLNTTWYFQTYYGAEKTAIPLKKNYALKFKEKQASIGWDANSCSGQYSHKAGVLKFLRDFGCTQICCDSEIAQELQKALYAGPLKIEKLNEETLKLKTSSDDIPVIFISKTPPANLDLIGSSWLIAKKENLTTNKVSIPKGKYSVRFSEKEVDIQLDVNTCTQEIQYQGQSFKVDPNGGFCTEACCDSKDAAQYSHILTNGMKFELDNNNLILFNKVERYTLSPLTEASYEAVNIEDLIGTTWESVDMTDKNAGLTQASASKYYIAFEKGRFSVKMPVNTCKTSFEADAEVLVLPNANMSCTKKCCDDKEDLAYLAHFKGRLKAVRKGDLLQLSNELVELRFKKQ